MTDNAACPKGLHKLDYSRNPLLNVWMNFQKWYVTNQLGSKYLLFVTLVFGALGLGLGLGQRVLSATPCNAGHGLSRWLDVVLSIELLDSR
jgi:hypothetical protein